MSNPHVEATLEDEILGALMLLQDPDHVHALIQEIDSEAFYSTRHEQALNALARALADGPGQQIQVNDVFRELRKSGDAKPDDGTLPWLMGLANKATPISSRVKKLIRELNELGANRALAAKLRELTNTVSQPGRTYDENWTAAQAAFVSDNRQGTTRDKSVNEALERLFDQMERARERGGVPEMTTGSAQLDEAIGGCPPGEYYLFGGAPASGKSVIATDFARAWLHSGKAALIFSLEMSQESLMARMISAEAKIPFRRLTSGMLSAAEVERVDLAAALLSSWSPRLKVIDRPVTASEIELEIARQKLDWDRAGLQGGVLIDYFQRITGPGSDDQRYAFFTNASMRLADAAKVNNVFVGVLAQFNRLGGHLPTLESFKETGQLELDATCAVLLHRPDQHDPTSDRPNAADFIVAKNRYLGTTGTIERVADLANSRFIDRDISATDPRNRPDPDAGGWGSPR